MVEIFSIITRQAIRRGTYTSVRDLIDAIRAFIDGWTTAATLRQGQRPPTNYSNTAGPVKERRLRDTSESRVG